ISMLSVEAETNRSNEDLDVHVKLDEAYPLKKRLDGLGRLVEGVRVLAGVRQIGVAEPGIIGRDHVKMVSQRRNEISVLMRRRRKSVQQNEFRQAFITSFPVENVDAVDIDGL